MDSFEFNKIAGTVLAALLLVFGAKTVRDVVMAHPPLAKPGYNVKVTTTASPTSTAPAKPKTTPAELVKLGNVEEGKSVFKKQCTTCHSDQKGGPNGTGPALYGVLNRDVGNVPGFAYSDAMKGKGGKWDYTLLQCYVGNPKECIPNNKMAFKGLDDEAELASVILYLRGLADSPAPLPQ
ncbi:MAG: cytochrome c family protein [Hyphomicrobiaceae bacterium]|nr:MAG: cytochrome c family protein [Hyphomicrobiaceae bacterium]